MQIEKEPITREKTKSDLIADRAEEYIKDQDFKGAISSIATDINMASVH